MYGTTGLHAVRQEMTNTPEQNWACSSHWGESGWRALGPGSNQRWLSYTWRLLSRERFPRWGPSPRSGRSSRPGQVWRGPPDSRTAVPTSAARAPVSSAPAPWSWASAGSSAPPRTAGESPVAQRWVQLVGIYVRGFLCHNTLLVSQHYSSLPRSGRKPPLYLCSVNVTVEGVFTGYFDDFPTASNGQVSLRETVDFQLFQECCSDWIGPLTPVKHQWCSTCMHGGLNNSWQSEEYASLV